MWLFVVEFATALANGVQPERLKFSNEKASVHVCALSTFRREPHATVKSTDFIELFCSCRNASYG